MRWLRVVFVFFLSVGLSACSSPYFEGRSPADVPAQINVINLKGVFAIEPGQFIATGENGEAGALKEVPEDKPEMKELISIVKRSIVNQFTNYGYTVVENEPEKAELSVKFVVSYCPELGILIHRAVSIWGYAYDSDDRQLFKKLLNDPSHGGLIESMFISRDEKVAAAGRKITVDMVEEMKKGTKGVAPSSPDAAKETVKEEPKS